MNIAPDNYYNYIVPDEYIAPEYGGFVYAGLRERPTRIIEIPEPEPATFPAVPLEPERITHPEQPELVPV